MVFIDIFKLINSANWSRFLWPISYLISKVENYYH